MRFSLITITYNAEKYLRQTLASVKEQTFTQFEHVVFDGGSQDNTLAIAREFPHIKVFEGEDEGIADAMNRAARFAKGEFLLHLHADDLLAHDKVLEWVDATIKAHPTQWLYGMASVIDAEGETIKQPHFVPYQKKRLQKYNILTHPATFVARKLFEEVGGFDPTLKLCMDYDLWLRLAQKSPPFALAAPLAKFRAHSGSVSTREKEEVAHEAYQVRQRYIKGMLPRYRSWRSWKRRLNK